MPSKPLLLADFADRYGLTIKMARGVITRREIPFHKVGNRILIDETDAETWWADQRVEAV